LSQECPFINLNVTFKTEGFWIVVHYQMFNEIRKICRSYGTWLCGILYFQRI